ncbi:ankyrin repeat-containing domain protein [Rhodocollybia butyracea]|uniref:Ankyrin repeat-containing domain protein n=1 Tax=Rhodocollybia butyracea TaxID=206335 RepID=A0A9P5PSD4_9AGAR|nr:ankyrin repeat-containing domain protein [Rhodocollybia butyracea]
MLTGASNFTVLNSQFQAATTIYNNYHTWNANDVLAIRKWLNAPNPSTNFVAACDKRTPETGDWIFSHPQFVEWNQSTSGLLWIQGKVGSGKTILSTVIIQNLKANPASLLCYYYFDNRDNSQTKTDARGLLQSLLLQMATRNEGTHPALHELYTTCMQGLMEPTTAELTQGQFRWVDCQVIALQKCATPKAIREALKKLPKTLEETYTLAFTRMKESEHVHDASQLLMWLAYALQPLSIGQVTDILAVDLEVQIFDPEARSLELEKRVYDILDSTLITVSVKKNFWSGSENEVVQLAHNSVKEFLTQTHAQGQTGKLQLSYVNWIRMYPDAEDELNHYYYPTKDPSELSTSLYYMACLGNKDFVLLLLEHKADVNVQGGEYGNALQAAISEGNKDIVQLLLEHKADVNAQGGFYGNVLQAAIIEGKKDIVQLLLEHKADVNPQGGFYGNALQAAANSGHMDIFELLLEHNTDVNAEGGFYGNALQAAAFAGKVNIVQLLLEHKADVNAQGGRYGTALQAAAFGRHKDTVQLLLEHKADVNAQGGKYWNALLAAASEGNKDIVQLLLAHKADVNAQGGKYGNPLQAAISEGNEDIVQLLLEHKADINAQGGEYGNALQAAASEGNKNIVQLLLKHKADVNAQGGFYGNALQAAAASWHDNKDLVQLLLEHKADVNAQGGKYGNALQAAASEGKEDIVRLLLEHNADVNAQGGEYGNALQAAASAGYEDIVQLLLEHKADVNAQGREYGTALQAAASKGNKDIVQLLLEHKADVNAQGGKYTSGNQYFLLLRLHLCYIDLTNLKQNAGHVLGSQS